MEAATESLSTAIANGGGLKTALSVAFVSLVSV